MGVTAVGEAVGAAVGEAVGSSVGGAVGSSVGAAVGVGVGSNVGEGVGNCGHMYHVSRTQTVQSSLTLSFVPRWGRRWAWPLAPRSGLPWERPWARPSGWRSGMPWARALAPARTKKRLKDRTQQYPDGGKETDRRGRGRGLGGGLLRGRRRRALLTWVNVSGHHPPLRKDRLGKRLLTAVGDEVG
jgi:hypothetical protein